MPVAYSYIRFSTPDQIKGDSLRRQLEASARYAAEHGLTLDDSLSVRDLGVSAFKGSNFERGALGQFVVAIDEGRVASGSYLLVESLDRLSRLPVTDALVIFQSIINRGITIVTLVDSAVYSRDRLKSDWTPLLIALVSMSRAHEESAVKSRRVKAAWDAKKERVRTKKEVMSGRCPWWLTVSEDGSAYEVIEANAEVVRLMFNLAKDGLGNWSITRHLNQNGVSTPQHSAHWQTSTVQFNLRNVAAIGVLQLDQDNNGRTTTNTFVEDYYPPIIDKALFYEVQALRAERNRSKNAVSAGRKGQCYNMFQGTAKCGYCGTSMYLRRKPGINTGFLYCGKSLRGAGCVGVSYNLRQLESEFIQFTRELDLMRVLGDTSEEDVLSAKKNELSACNAMLEAAQGRLKNLLTAVELGGDVAMLVDRMRDMEAQVNEQKKRHLELKAEVQILSNTNRNEKAALDAMGKLMEQLESKDSDLDEKLRLRYRMLAEVQKVVRRLDLFPAGDWMQPEKREELRQGLRAVGFDEERIAAYEANFPEKPDRTARFFVAHLRSGIVRTVHHGRVLDYDAERNERVRATLREVTASASTS